MSNPFIGMIYKFLKNILNKEYWIIFYKFVSDYGALPGGSGRLKREAGANPELCPQL